MPSGMTFCTKVVQFIYTLRPNARWWFRWLRGGSADGHGDPGAGRGGFDNRIFLEYVA